MKHELMSQNTRLLLAASLKGLMSKKPLKKITISELVADCGLNRNTFYYHFQDIYDLLKWMLDQEAYETFRRFNLDDSHEQAFQFVAEYVMANRGMLSSAVDGIGRDSLQRFLHSDFHGIIRTIIDRTDERLNAKCDPGYKAFLADMYTEATAGVLIKWLREPEAYTKEQLVQYMQRAFLYALPAALRQEP